MFIFHRIVLSTVLGGLTAYMSMAVQAGNPRFQEAISPDHSMVAYVNAEEGDSEIYIERANGTERRRLTTNDCYDNDPSWSPDGNRIAFASDRSGNWQIHRMDTDGGNLVQLTKQESGCAQPKYGSKGQLAYLIRRGRKVKRELFDLVVSEGEELERLEQGIPIYSYAWHPDGERVGCASDGRFMLHNLREGTTKLVEFKDTDERLSSYSIVDCRWSTRLQGFVGHLRFLGGVPMPPDGEGTKIFADGELFLIPIERKARFVADESPDTTVSRGIGSGKWSKAVVDKSGYALQGRLVICEKFVSDDRREVVVYVELRDATPFLGSPMRLYCDMGRTDFRPEHRSGLQCELKDENNHSVESAAFGFGGAVPLSQWVTLPSDATIRLRASPFGIHHSQGMAISPHLGTVWVIGDDDSNDYSLSGTFAIISPENSVSPSDEHVWTGTIDLPPIPIVNKHRKTNRPQSDGWD
jgi:hypothetical protein